MVGTGWTEQYLLIRNKANTRSSSSSAGSLAAASQECRFLWVTLKCSFTAVYEEPGRFQAAAIALFHLSAWKFQVNTRVKKTKKKKRGTRDEKKTFIQDFWLPRKKTESDAVLVPDGFRGSNRCTQEVGHVWTGPMCVRKYMRVPREYQQVFRKLWLSSW